MRQLFLLNGLAIFAVVCNHAAHKGFLPMFWWTDRYIPGATVPNYDQYGSLSYYALIAIIKLTFFAIPAFLFVSGFFIAYTSRGRQSALSWIVVRTRIINLVIPYLIWSFVFFGYFFLQSCRESCTLDSPSNYLWKLLTGNATNAYWYVPLIIQFYLLSPFLVILAKTRWKIAILIGTITQLCAIVITYLGILGVEIPRFIVVTFTTVLFPRDLIYFIIGLVAGFHFSALKQWLVRVRWKMMVLWVISIILVLTESELIFRITEGPYYLGHVRGGYFTIPMTMYVITFIFTFLAFEKVSLPASNIVLELGRRSYGIFLMHMLFIMSIPTVLYHLWPWVLGRQILYQPILIVSAVGFSYLFMSIIAKTRLRWIYRYLFG